MTVHIFSDRVADKDYGLIVYVKDASSSATVHPLGLPRTFEDDIIVPDAIFGVELNGILQETLIVRAGRTSVLTQFFFWNDYYVEEEECFTLQISPETDNDTFNCTTDANDRSDYFCLLTICIEDNDKDGKFIQP